MQIVESDEQPAKAKVSIRKSVEPVPNVAVERDWRSAKQFSESC
jgi:hypothetical protein